MVGKVRNYIQLEINLLLASGFNKLTLFSSSISLELVSAKVMLGCTNFFVILWSTIIVIIIMPKKKEGAIMGVILRLNRMLKLMIPI